MRVTVRATGGEDPGFEFEIRLVADADADGTSWSEQCALCTEAELVDAVALELDKVAGSIRALEDDAEREQERPPPPVVEAPAEPPIDDVDRSLPTSGKVGIGLLAGGVIGIGVGIGLVLAPAQPLADDPLRERYTQPPGYAVLAVGGACTVIGAVLLGLAVRKQKQARTQMSSSGLRLTF